MTMIEAMTQDLRDICNNTGDTTMTQRHFYARRWTYGYNAVYETPRGVVPAYKAVAFRSAVARDAWVENGTASLSESNYRESVTRRDLLKTHLDDALTDLTWGGEAS